MRDRAQAVGRLRSYGDSDRMAGVNVAGQPHDRHGRKLREQVGLHHQRRTRFSVIAGDSDRNQIAALHAFL